MICPSCKAVVDVLEGACPTCQSDAQLSTIVESTPRGATLAVARQPIASSVGERLGDGSSTAFAAPNSVWPLEVRAPAAYALQRRPPSTHPMLAALPQLPALLWRQPIVRATVRTGASAVALSLALRMARRMLANRAAPLPPASAALPTLADLFAPPSPTARHHIRRLHRRRQATHDKGEAVETLIYIRRVFYNAH